MELNAMNRALERGIPKFESTVDNSLLWRIWHGTNYMFGGIFFVLGSTFYYPYMNDNYNGAVVGGWLFTIGSTNFLLADLTEWNHFKFGCIGQPKSSALDSSLEASFRRAEFGLNFFISVIGSFFYLLGSIFFIPATNMLAAGEETFIIGSMIIFLSQLWKCLRSASTNEADLNDNRLRYENIKPDLSGFLVDFWAGMGGLFYAIGTWLFQSYITDEEYLVAVHVFVCGGISFTLSGLAMQWRYYLGENTENIGNRKEYRKEEYTQI